MEYMNRPMISIVVPIYNIEHFLEKCIENLVWQTYSNIEIILVDDGSQDKSGDICDWYAKMDERIVVIHQENGGVTAARKTGIRNAHGKYLMFVDGDDWVDACICEELLKAIDEYRTQSAICGYVREYADRSLPTILYKENVVLEGSYIARRICGPVGGELASPERMESLNTTCGRLYPLELVKNIAMLDVDMVGSAEDAFWNIEAYLRIENAVYIGAAYYHYRKENANSITSTYRPKLIWQQKELYRNIEAVIHRENLDVLWRKALQNRIALNTLGIGLNCVGDDASFREKCKRIYELLTEKQRKMALKQLALRGMPIHWKLFYFCAKKHWAIPVVCLLNAIKVLKRKI